MMPQTRLSRFNIELLDRYLAGAATDREQAQVEAWIEADPTRRMTIDALRRTLAGRPSALPVDLDGEWLRLQRGYRENSGIGHTEKIRPTTIRERRLSIISVFATIAVVVSAAVATYVGRPQCNNDTCEFRPAVTAYTTAAGERATINLSDGTTVILNVASRLEIPDNFTRDRVVSLTGQAYFNVAHATETPFRVNANATRITVLGTEFSVRAYDSKAVDVAVRSGKVQLDAVTLVAHDIAHAALDGSIVKLSQQNVEPLLAFAQGRLIFNDVRFRDVIDELNRWYNVEIQLADPSIGDRVIGSAILENGSVGDLMDILRRTFQVQVVRTGRNITLSSH